MANRKSLGDVVETERRNALVAWIVVAFFGLVVIASVVDGDLLWAGFAAVAIVIAVFPAIAYRRTSAMLPWEVLVLAALPVIGRVFATVPLTSRFATYLSVAALALIIAVEFHTFTSVSMTPGFAVLFVVIATMATAGVWAVVRWLLDVSLGTTFLLRPELSPTEIETRLMWEFVYSTGAGVVAGAIFEGYFRRRARIADRFTDVAD